MKLDEYDLKILDKASKVMMTNYHIKKYPDYNEGYIEHDDLIVMVEDLLSEIDHLQEQIDDLEDYDEETIRDPYDYYGVSRHDFY